jgi:type 1 glutamine amidotransferase
MKRKLHIVFLSILLAGMVSCKKDKKEVYPPKTEGKTNVLVFSKTAGYRHESIAAGIDMFQSHAEEWQLNVTTTETTEKFSGDGLKEFTVLVLLNTTGDYLTDAEQERLVDFVRSGGRILAVHAAADAEYNWPWYNHMLGAWFLSHPAIQQANCILEDPVHSAGKEMPAIWTRTDEWYNFKDIQPYIHIVYSVDENSYSGGMNGADHPISWYHNFEGGKIFYTAMGHTYETYSEPYFIQHIAGALEWLKQ